MQHYENFRFPGNRKSTGDNFPLSCQGFIRLNKELRAVAEKVLIPLSSIVLAKNAGSSQAMQYHCFI
jgi:hypothetical protein